MQARRGGMRPQTIKTVSAGQIDTALSAIATLIIGLYAVRVFDATLLGAYVVVFTAWNFARSIPSELVFTPSEVLAVARPEPSRIQILDSSVRRGLLISILGAVGILASAALVRDVPSEDIWALTLTGAAITVLAPLQEHWRKMFHISNSSWSAAITSTVAVIGTVIGVFILHRTATPAWVPFGSLAIGLFMSSVSALLLTFPLRRRSGETLEAPAWLELTTMGRWLLVANLSFVGADFLVAVIANALVGAEILGYAEGARVVARPVAILGLGLIAVIGPRSIEAGMTVDHQKARVARKQFWIISLIGGLLYLPLVGFNWSLNPLVELLPNAYAVNGLVAIAIIGTILYNTALPWRSELLGGQRQRHIAASEATGAGMEILTGAFAPVWQAFTLPIAWGAGWLARSVSLGLSARRLFRDGSKEAGPSERNELDRPPEPVRHSSGTVDAPPGTPLLSICIPTYERPDFLEACLRSVIDAPHPPDGTVELVVSDNSASPKTLTTLDELFARWNGPTRYVHNDPAVTAEENFNLCLELGRGTWLLILHDDDSLAEGALPILQGIYDTHPDDMVLLFGVRVVDGSGKTKKTQRFLRPTRLDPVEALRRVLTDSSWVRFPGLVARRAAYEAVGQFDADLKNPTDLDMWVRLFASYGVLCLPQISANYTIHSGALTEGMFRAETISRLEVIFERASRTGLLTDSELRRRKAALFHQFVLAGAWRRLRELDRRGAKRVMGLFGDENVRNAGWSLRWLPVRAVLRLLTF